MDCSTPGFPVLHQFPELAQTHVHWVGDAIQPSHPVIPFSCLQSFPASKSFPMGQFFVTGGQSIAVSATASVLPMNIQYWFWRVWSPCCPRDSQESSPAPQLKQDTDRLKLINNPGWISKGLFLSICAWDPPLRATKSESFERVLGLKSNNIRQSAYPIGSRMGT